MAKQQSANKVSVDVYEKDRKFFASVDLADSQHSLGPSASREEIYHQIFNFISDLRLVAEIDQAQQHSSRDD